jgi:signal transduction histidine kinase
MGISAVDDLPWGSHLCLFHETTEDLLTVVVPYFKAGLEDGELCLWVLAPTLTESAALRALRDGIPDLDRFLDRRSLELVSHDAWYLAGGIFDLQRVVAAWYHALDQASARGFAGIRVTGSGAWLYRRDWRDFREYEDLVSASMADRRMLALCTFPIGASAAADVLDVSDAHQVTLALRNGVWERLETPERIAERMRALETANAELASLSRTRMNVDEAERRRFARELHDEMGGALTGITMMLGAGDRALETARAAVTELMERVRSMSFDLRAPALDDLGLLSALLTHVARYTAQTGIRVQFAHIGLHRRFRPEVETAAYRIIQEALTNVARHAAVAEVSIRVRANTGLLRIQIDDQGGGFDLAAVALGGGLVGMRERAQLLGGRLRLDSAPGQGTRVSAELPLD